MDVGYLDTAAGLFLFFLILLFIGSLAGFRDVWAGVGFGLCAWCFMVVMRNGWCVYGGFRYLVCAAESEIPCG